MARKKSAKTEEQEEFDVDEPSEVDEGQNDGDSSSNENSGPRRKSGRTRTVKKPSYQDEGSSEDLDNEDEDEDDEEDESDDDRPPVGKKKGQAGGVRGGRGGAKGKGRGRGKPPAKKAKLDEDNEDSDDIDGEESEGDTADTPPEFRSGCFVVLKSDIDNKTENHPLWKIDGKSLLQKFDRVVKDDEVFYKSTTIYAGWSKTVLETYYPIKVEYKKADIQECLVKFDPSQIDVLKKEKEEE